MPLIKNMNTMNVNAEKRRGKLIDKFNDVEEKIRVKYQKGLVYWETSLEKHNKKPKTQKNIDHALKKEAAIYKKKEKYQMGKIVRLEKLNKSTLETLDYFKSKYPELFKRDRIGKGKYNNIKSLITKNLTHIHSQHQQITKYTVIKEKTAFQGRVEFFKIPSNGVIDLESFLIDVKPTLFDLIIKFGGEKGEFKLSSSVVLKMSKTDYSTGWKEIDFSHIRAQTAAITHIGTLESIWEEIEKELKINFSALEKNGSGWVLETVDSFHIHLTKTNPQKGAGKDFKWKTLPKSIRSTKSTIFMKNEDDDECFKWSITRALNPIKVNSERITKKLRKQAEQINFNGIQFPVKVKDIIKFEKDNPTISVNVFHYFNGKVGRLRVTEWERKNHINLLLHNDHYSIIKNLERLLSTQLSKNKRTKELCNRCGCAFGTRKLLIRHRKFCEQKDFEPEEIFPEEGETMQFTHFERSVAMPVVGYGDFESGLKPIQTCENDPKKSSTTAYQEHEPFGYCFKICSTEHPEVEEMRSYTKTNETEQIGKMFMEDLENSARKIYNDLLSRNEKMVITDLEENEFHLAETCYLCEEKLYCDRVRDHCHLTGKYRGACHSNCNLKLKTTRIIPILFHNLEGYDSHLFLEWLGYTKSTISCIPKTDEKYISFSKKFKVDEFIGKDGKNHAINIELRFLDSMKFLQMGLDKVAKSLDESPDAFVNLQKYCDQENYSPYQFNLIRKKGIFPYDLMKDLKAFELNELPTKEQFFNKLNNVGITDEQYEHAKNVWKAFKCKTMRDYHDLYLKSDVLILADVMQMFRKMCMKNYKLDPLHYFTFPGLAMDACMKMTKIKLELLTDPEMYLMIERGLRGGVSSIAKRFSEANHKYLKDYDPTKPSIYITYLDINNLYGVPMSGNLPVGNFKWVDKNNFSRWRNYPCFLEVDIDYPDHLHDLHSDLPFCPEKIKLGNVEKLVGNLNNKRNYVIHHEALKCALDHGLVLKKIHRVISFDETSWMKKYISTNTKLRIESKSEFGKNFFKLANNAVFGKTMENVRNHVDVRIINSQSQLDKLTKLPNFDRIVVFNNHLVAVHMKRLSVKLNKPIYLGMTILDVSKTVVYNFWYNYLKEKYGEKCKLILTDTDSVIPEIETDDFYKDISADVHTHFDTSNYKKGHPSGIEVGVNEKIIGMMKDECGGRYIKKVVALRPKCYAIQEEDLKEDKKCKGVKSGVVKNTLKIDDYEKCLFSGEKVMRKQNTIRSRGHKLYSETMNKVALSRNDDKRIILPDEINTLAIGHYKARK